MAANRIPDTHRPSTPPPAVSWWATPRVQHDRAAFDAENAEQAKRMNAVETTLHSKRKDGDS